MLTVCLFGRFEPRHDGAAVAGLEARKVQELLAVLLLSKNHSVHREILADRLWPDVDTARARKYLRQALWQLQRCGDEDGMTSVVHADPEWRSLTSSGSVWFDVVQFQNAYDGIVSTGQSSQLSADNRRRLRQAATLYRGELLGGWYQDWCCDAREHLRVMYLTMLSCLLEDAYAIGDWRAGLIYGRIALEEDRADEHAHLLLMRFHCMAGNRTGALRQYDRCKSALREEFAVEPAEDIQRLRRDLCAPVNRAAHPPAKVPGEPGDIAPALQSLRAAVQEMQAELGARLPRVS